VVRPLLVVLVLYAGAAIAADSLHLAPVGTVLSDSFTLAGKSIPLPAGKFVLAASSVNQPPWLEGDISKRRPKVARVFLVQIEPPRLRAAVVASAALTPPTFRFNWAGQACKKEDTLYRADLTGSNGGDENCLLVDHRLINLGPKSQGIWKDAATWLAEQQVQLPVPVLIVASVTRTEGWQLVAASYAFNPRMYGCNAPRSRSWARFVESVTAWGKGVQHHFNELIEGRQPQVAKALDIYPCASAQALLNTP
jgi:hypothetical protein